MLAQICQFLAIDSSSFPKNENIIIGDRSNEGGYLVNYFLNLCLKQKRGVCFVGFNQSFNHYNTIAQKLGTNLLLARDENKNLIFIEGLQLFRDCILSTLPSNCDVESIQDLLNGDFLPFVNFVKSSLDKLSLRESTNKPVVIIDDLSLLLNSGIPCKTIITLINSLHNLLKSKGGSLVCFMQVQLGDEEAEKVYAFASHLSTLIIEVSDLKTGYCKDVHGQMEVLWRSSELSPKKYLSKTTQFKVTDKIVHLFASGYSTAVL